MRSRSRLAQGGREHALASPGLAVAVSTINAKGSFSGKPVHAVNLFDLLGKGQHIKDNGKSQSFEDKARNTCFMKLVRSFP